MKEELHLPLKDKMDIKLTLLSIAFFKEFNEYWKSII